MSANIERVLDEIKSLTPEERRQVRVALEIWELAKPSPQQRSEEEFEQLMEELGIISRPREPLDDEASFSEFKPIKILDGKPVSETIIEERR